MDNSSAFLSLPRELKDIIYQFLFNEVQEAPENPEHAGERVQHGSTYFELRSPKPALLQLKLVCRSTYADVHDLLKNHIDDGQACLDIMVKGSSIWPTWTCLPLTPHIHPVITIDVRLFEASGWGSEFSTSAYRALWTLFNLLVFKGPCFTHNTVGLRTPLHFARLRFEIWLCFPTSVDDLFGTYRDVFDRLERLASDNVGLGNVDTIEACLGVDQRIWRLKQLPTGLTHASRV
jgi:hypothetical protein